MTMARNLELIMQHQDAFLPALNHDRDGLLQVRAPTRKQTETASAAIAAVHLQVNSITTQLTA
jgi:hypothetical protein